MIHFDYLQETELRYIIRIQCISFATQAYELLCKKPDINIPYPHFFAYGLQVGSFDISNISNESFKNPQTIEQFPGEEYCKSLSALPPEQFITFLLKDILDPISWERKETKRLQEKVQRKIGTIQDGI